MKSQIINDDIILIDDVLSDVELDLMRKNIISLKDKLVYHDEFKMTGFNNTLYHRVYLDELFIDNRGASYILAVITRKIFNKDINKAIKDMESYPFQSLNYSDRHETQLTVYDVGGKYNWHRDNDQKRIMSFVLPINVYKKTWTGGELLLKYKGETITIEPKENQLIMFSGHLLHRVKPIVMDNPGDILKGRVIINGHIGYDVGL